MNVRKILCTIGNNPTHSARNAALVHSYALRHRPYRFSFDRAYGDGGRNIVGGVCHGFSLALAVTRSTGGEAARGIRQSMCA